MGKAGLVLLACTLAACLQSSLETCEDGRVCPPGLVCDTQHDLCVLDEQLDSCGSDPDGTPCDIGGAPAGYCDDGVCIRSRCQDGIVAPNEDCEPSLALELDCTDLGYYEAGTVGCADDCTFDVSGCTGGICGDGAVDDPEEDCDAPPGVVVAQCDDLDFYDPGDVTCSSICRYQVSSCTGFCGDLLANGEESCDGTPPTGGACVDFGFDYGALVCSDFCTPGFDDCGAIGWERFAGLTGNFRSVWSWGDGSEALAGGEHGRLAVWNGTTWLEEPSAPLLGDITGLWGPSPVDVFVVTSLGEVARWNGSAWSVESTPPGEPLSAVSGTSASDVWAVGGHRSLNVTFGEILHRDASGWTRVDDGTLPWLTDIQAIAVDDVWAVGPGGAMHWDGVAWSPVAELAGAGLLAVWASSSVDVYVVGVAGDLRHFDGVSWRAISLGTSEGLLDVRGSGASDVYVSTEEGGFHYDGRAWWPTDLPPSTALWFGPGAAFAASSEMWRRSPSWFDEYVVPSPADLFAVGGTGPTDAFAAGEGGTILRYDGFTWRATSSACPGTITGIWEHLATCPDGLQEWNGTAWVRLDIGIAGTFADVWGTGPSDVWVVGDRIVHYDGTAWTEVPSPGSAWTDIDGCASNDAYVVGNTGVAHWDGAAWTLLALDGVHRDVWCNQTDDVWIVGDGGEIQRWDGTTWNTLASPPYDYTAVSGTGGADVYFASASYRMHWNGTQLADGGAGMNAVWFSDGVMFEASADLDARATPGASVTMTPQVFGWMIFGSDDVFAVGSGTLHFDGTIWSTVNVGSATAIWGTSDTDLYLATSGSIAHWDGAAWAYTATPPMNAIHGIASDDIWAVGAGTRHHDASGWTAVPSPATGLLGDVWMIASNDVYAVGNEVLHWNGAAWSEETNGSHLNAVWAAAPDDVFAVGAQGTILHKDGTTWWLQTSPVTTDLYSVWGTAGDDVFAAGAGGRLIHYDGSVWSPVRLDSEDALNAIRGDQGALYIGRSTLPPLRLYQAAPW